MYLKITYDQDFDDLIMHLKSKYPKKLFDLDGIGEQTDMSKFSRKFFSSKVTADASVDANANVDDISVIVYNTELPKPFFRLNSYYILWKELKRLYGLEVANIIVEKQLTGDIYIHDFHGVAGGLPYSYFGKTSIAVKINNDLKYVTMEELYDLLLRDNSSHYENNAETINPINLKVLDDNNEWVKVNRILKHKSHTNLVQLETKNGRCTVVTSDHPVITDKGDISANKLTLNDTMKISSSKLPLIEAKKISDDYAYFVGFMIGDGWIQKTKGKTVDIRRGNFAIKQNNIVKTKIYNTVNKIFNNVTLIEDDKITFGYKADIEKLLSTGIGSINRKLPNDILEWNKDAILALIAGVIDSDGNINKNGMLTIRVVSYELVQQLGELFRTLGLGKTRTSFAGKYHSVSGYNSDNDVYRLSCRLYDKALINHSEKVRENETSIFKPMKIDGRFEGNKLHKIKAWDTPEYVYDITTESGHFHCQGLVQHNCFNYSTYDILIKGLPMVKKIKSLPPKYLYAFKSQLEQFTVIASNSTLGATGLADVLVVISYYVKNILQTKSDAHFKFQTEEDCWKYIKENLISFIYTINQPMRANQSPFTNISVYDKYFLEKLCNDYIFPDGSTPDVDIINKLQELYLDIMNEELKRTAITFPVTTACFSINEEGEVQDDEFVDFIAEKNMEYGFINIYSGDSSTLSSCCRLRSEQDSEYFNSFGSGSSKIGSLGVVSINFPRLAVKSKNEEDFFVRLKDMIEVCARINNAKRHIVRKRIDNGNHPLYTLGFMDLEKQYSTVGVNGLNECIELMNYNILDEDGQNFTLKILESINDENKKFQKQYGSPHNCEQVPGENMSIKMTNKDNIMGLNPNEYEIYSNQFIPLTVNADMLDRMKLQGIFDKKFSGGAICHINVDTHIKDKEKIKNLIKTASKMGIVYWAINYNLQECTSGHISVGRNENCSICGSPIENNYTRVVG